MATSLSAQSSITRKVRPPLSFLWLEITGKCNLRCTHCYAESQPTGSHGTLTQEDWQHVITEATNLGVETVQFIGGEPTLHPEFAALVRFAAEAGVGIEVYTNLLRVPKWMWQLFQDCHVSLATSFYSGKPDAHDRVTTRKGSQQRTLSNIQEALARRFPLRVGIISVFGDQGVPETEQMLRSLGVTNVGVDQVRGIGRGAMYSHHNEPTAALCGACSNSMAAVDPDGWVYPCVFSRWLKIGNVLLQDFAQIIASQKMRSVRQDLDQAFSSREVSAPRAVVEARSSAHYPHEDIVGRCDQMVTDITLKASAMGCLPPPPPGPCPPNTGYCPPRIMCVPQTGPAPCFPNGPCVPSVCQPTAGTCGPTYTPPKPGG